MLKHCLFKVKKTGRFRDVKRSFRMPERSVVGTAAEAGKGWGLGQETWRMQPRSQETC